MIKENSSLQNLSDQKEYAAAFRQTDREAKATFIAAVAITVIFWTFIALTHDSLIQIMYMPLWFFLSCIGGYVLSVAVVLILVRYFMKDINLKYQCRRGEEEDR